MKTLEGKPVLVSGASIAGLALAYQLGRLGAHVTVVERAAEPRLGGAAVNVEGAALVAAEEMGLLAGLRAHAVHMTRWEYKDATDATVGTMHLPTGEAEPGGGIEIERAELIRLLLGALDAAVTFRFNDRVTALADTGAGVQATFANGSAARFELVFGCDGLHSGVRRLWFGAEAGFAHYLGYYFSLTTVPRLLIEPQTVQLYNEPGKVVMLNAYHGKTDIVFGFAAPAGLAYDDYRDAGQQGRLVAAQLAGMGWRTAELLAEVERAGTAYFDAFGQIRMPAWARGRVALVGDAAYCASPAAGCGASLALLGAAEVARALAAHGADYAAAFRAYEAQLRPFVEEVQAAAPVFLGEYMIPATEEGIRARNARETVF